MTSSNATGLRVPSIAAVSEVQDNVREFKLTPKEIEIIVSQFPRNTDYCFYNDIFERDSFIFIINGEWKFLNNAEVIQDWDWKKDLDDIYKIIENDACGDLEAQKEENQRFEDGWSITNVNSLEMTFGEEELEEIGFDSPFENMDIPAILSKGMSIEERALLIMRESCLSDEERVKRILALKPN
jgi:hypothetical protein